MTDERRPGGQIPPTGNTVSFPFSCFFRVRDSRCVSYHIYYESNAFGDRLVMRIPQEHVE